MGVGVAVGEGDGSGVGVGVGPGIPRLESRIPKKFRAPAPSSS